MHTFEPERERGEGRYKGKKSSRVAVVGERREGATRTLCKERTTAGTVSAANKRASEQSSNGKEDRHNTQGFVRGPDPEGKKQARGVYVSVGVSGVCGLAMDGHESTIAGGLLVLLLDRLSYSFTHCILHTAYCPRSQDAGITRSVGSAQRGIGAAHYCYYYTVPFW